MITWLLAAAAATLVLAPSRVLARGSYAGLVARGNVSSPFGPRGAEGVHAGIDVAAPEGSEVRVASNGILVELAPDGARSGYGNVAIIRHFDGTLTLYAHMKSFGPGLRVGEPINAGTVLGYVGNTQAPKTKPMRPHLHFEVLKNEILWQGKVVANSTTPTRLDPQPWLKRNGRPVADAAA